jgi:hypothetical protein
VGAGLTCTPWRASARERGASVRVRYDPSTRCGPASSVPLPSRETCPYGLRMRWDNKLTLLLEVSIVHFFPNLHSEKSTAII